jgi:hypothetical protein
MATLGKELGITTSPARGIQGDADRQGVDDLLDHGLVDVEGPIGLVICGRPQSIAGDRVHPVDFHGCVCQSLVGEHPADLRDPCRHEVAIRLPGERAQQRNALKPEQIRPRVFIAHLTEASDAPPDRPPTYRVASAVSLRHAQDQQAQTGENTRVEFPAAFPSTAANPTVSTSLDLARKTSRLPSDDASRTPHRPRVWATSEVLVHKEIRGEWPQAPPIESAPRNTDPALPATRSRLS